MAKHKLCFFPMEKHLPIYINVFLVFFEKYVFFSYFIEAVLLLIMCFRIFCKILQNILLDTLKFPTYDKFFPIQTVLVAFQNLGKKAWQITHVQAFVRNGISFTYKLILHHITWNQSVTSNTIQLGIPYTIHQC